MFKIALMNSINEWKIIERPPRLQDATVDLFFYNTLDTMKKRRLARLAIKNAKNAHYSYPRSYAKTTIEDIPTNNNDRVSFPQENNEELKQCLQVPLGEVDQELEKYHGLFHMFQIKKSVSWVIF